MLERRPATKGAGAAAGVAALVLIAIWSVPRSACGQTAEDAALRELQELIEATHKYSARGSPQQANKDRCTAYTRLLRKLARARGRGRARAAPERTALQKELVAIARSYAADQNLMDELVRFYGPPQSSSRFRRRVQLPPKVSSKHATEQYRLAWEALVLAPPTRKIRFLKQMHRDLEALQQIGRSVSAPVLVEAFRFTTARNVPQRKGYSVNCQERILMTLAGGFYDETALEGILTCLALADKRCRGKDPKREGYYTNGRFTLRELTIEYLMLPNNSGKSELDRKGLEHAKKWQAVIANYSKPNLSERNRKFLRELKSYRRPGEETGGAPGTARASSSPSPKSSPDAPAADNPAAPASSSLPANPARGFPWPLAVAAGAAGLLIGFALAALIFRRRRG